MRVAWAIWRRECGAFFLSPQAYVTLTVFLAMAGLSFWNVAVEGMQDGTPLSVLLFGPLFYWLMILVVIAVITMRLMAEETRSGTLEMLSTAPVREAEIVIGKFGAGLTCFLVIVLPTAVYPYLLSLFSSGIPPIDWVQVGVGYAGLACIAAFYVAIGLLVSCLTSSQLAAAIGSMAVFSVLFFIELFWRAAPAIATERVLAGVSAIQHVADFSHGIVDSRAVVFYASGTAVALFLGVQTMERRRRA